MNTQKHPSESDPEKEKLLSELELLAETPTTKIFVPNSEKEETLLQLLSQQKKTVPSQSTLHSSVRGENPSILVSKMGQLFTQERYQPLETVSQKESEIWQYMRDSWLDRKVLRKQVHFNATDKNATLAFQRLRREAQITGVLEHPNIVPLHDMQQEKNGDVFFTLRTMEGETLFSFFQKNRLQEKPLDESFFLGIFLKVCDAVAYAHSRSIVHGSLKPSTVWIGSFGEVYVSDWSAAKYFEEQGQPTIDIEALGKMLRQGFLRISPEEEAEMMTISSQRRKLKQWIRERIPVDLQWIIYKAIEGDWKKRYPHLQNFVDDIERYQKNLRVSSRKYTREELLSKWMQRNSRALKVGSVISILLAILLLYFQWLRMEERKKTFQSTCTQARETLSTAKQMKDQNRAISLFLSSFHQFRIALSVELDERVERERQEVGRIILDQAYQNQEYALAQYVAQELGIASSEIVEKQLKIRKEHLQKLEDWIRVLKNTRQTDLLREEALLEICKMKEEEVFEVLKKHLEEGTQYFLSESRNTRMDEFYGTVFLILGHLGNRKGIESFVFALEQLSKKLASNPQDVAYLILLTKGLIHFKPIAPELTQRLRKLREQLGPDNLYTQQTVSLMNTLEQEH